MSAEKIVSKVCEKIINFPFRIAYDIGMACGAVGKIQNSKNSHNTK